MTIQEIEKQLLAKVRRYPDDDQSRVDYALWLAKQVMNEQHGLQKYDERQARSNFILCQLKLEREGIRPTIIPRSGCPDYDHPTKCQEQGLLGSHQRIWDRPLRQCGATNIVFRRGFPTSFEITARDFAKHGEYIVAAEPLVRSIHVTDCEDNKIVEALAASPALAHMTSLDFTDSQLTDEGIRILADSPQISHLNRIELNGTELSNVAAEALANSRHLTNLSSFSMCRTNLSDIGVHFLARSPYLRNLTRLDLLCNEITSNGARALISRTNLPNMVFCDVSGNSRISTRALEEIERILDARRNTVATRAI